MTGTLTAEVDRNWRYVPLRALSRLSRFGPSISITLSTWLSVDQRLRVRLSDSRVLIRRSGLWWDLDLASNHSRSMYTLGIYDAPLMRAIVRSLRPSDVLFDVGANVGLVALPAAVRLRKLGVGQVVAIEPAPDVVGELRRNIEINDLDGWIDVIPSAVGSHVGSADLRVGEDQSDVGLRTLAGEGAAVGCVPVTTLDTLYEEERICPTIIKIDVEGWETEVLRGASRCIEEGRPRLCIVECVEEHLIRAGSSREELHGLMASFGYEGHWIRHRGFQRIRDFSENLTTNIAYVRRSSG